MTKRQQERAKRLERALVNEVAALFPRQANKTIIAELTGLQRPLVVFEMFLHLVKIRPVGIGSDENSLRLMFPTRSARRVNDALFQLHWHSSALDERDMKVRCEDGICSRYSFNEAIPQASENSENQHLATDKEVLQ